VTGELFTKLREALEREPAVALALVFGSRARGRERADSDLDLAVHGAAVDPLGLGARLSLALGVEVDVLDLEQVTYPLLRELVEHARVVMERPAGAAAAWRSRAIATIETDRPWFERMRDAYLARLAAGGASW
jgi:predicted nucleotidyltransferase